MASPFPSWVVLSTIWNVLAEKGKLKIDCNFQFLDFRRKQKHLTMPQTATLSEKQNCRSV